MNNFNFARAGQMPAGTMDASTDVGLRKFMLGVYNKMGLGLLLTAALAWIVASTPIINMFFSTSGGAITGLSPLSYVVAFGPIAILFGSAFLMKNPSPVGANIVYWSVVSLIGTSMGLLVFVYAGIPDGMDGEEDDYSDVDGAGGGVADDDPALHEDEDEEADEEGMDGVPVDDGDEMEDMGEDEEEGDVEQ